MKDWLRSYWPPLALTAWMLTCLWFHPLYEVSLLVGGVAVFCGIVIGGKRGVNEAGRD